AAAVLGREGLLTAWRPDSYTSTFLTNAVNLAAAVAAVRVVVEEDLPGRAARIGPPAMESLAGLLAGHPAVAEVRGRGLWLGVELVDPEGAPDPSTARAAQRLLRGRGVLVGLGGHDENVLKVSPPLVIDEDELERGLRELAAAVDEVGEGG
ncbi:MAG: aminotransferase class III-fold pyridoxal phosphate-dependent enzyme, partial [Actinobacteria bacterium]|nr:aminotransferase class III-fold pyridoxal phosphate-dependent enzyme [Actinomycetota bacterium]